MTPQLIHQKVRTRLNEINNNIYENLLPEEIDIALNESLIDLLSAKSENTFGILSLKDLEHFQELVEIKTVNVYKDTNDIEDRVYTFLPDDCFHLINCNANINCKNNFTLENKNRFVYSFQLENIQNNNGFYYQGFFIFILVEGTIYTKPVGATYSSFEELFQIKDTIFEDVTKKDLIGVYNERYNNDYYPNKILFVADKSIPLYSSFQPVGAVLLPLEKTFVLKEVKGDVHKKVDTRVLDFESLKISKNSVYRKTNINSPIVSLNKNTLNIFYNKKFIPISLEIAYIKNPRKINLPLNRSFDLTNVKAIEKIISHTVNKISVFNNNTNAQLLNQLNDTNIQKEKNNII
jgi:hypothetical protein